MHGPGCGVNGEDKDRERGRNPVAYLGIYIREVSLGDLDIQTMRRDVTPCTD